MHLNMELNVPKENKKLEITKVNEKLEQKQNINVKEVYMIQLAPIL